MSGLSPETVKHHVRVYVGVFIALAILTAITVSVSYLHLPIIFAVSVALFIAIFKGSLVAAFFMHLSTEKKIVFVVLILAFIFFLVLLFVPAIAHY